MLTRYYCRLILPKYLYQYGPETAGLGVLALNRLEAKAAAALYAKLNGYSYVGIIAKVDRD